MKNRRLQKNLGALCCWLAVFSGMSILCAQSQSLARIEQVGNNNFSSQKQIGNNDAYILQRSLYQNTAKQDQFGSLNKAVILQKDTHQSNIALQKQLHYNNRASIRQEAGSKGNRAEQYQEGRHNTGGGPDLYDEVTGYFHKPVDYGAVIEQTGAYCDAVQRQYGDNNYNYIRQEGYRQEAEVIQRGSGLSHVLVQESTYIGPKYTITQTSSPLGEFFPRQAMIVHQR